MRSLIVGMGEVGRALREVLAPAHTVFTKDVEDAPLPERVDVMHVCVRHTPGFLAVVRDYAERCRPRLIDVCSTVPPGTTERLGPTAVHSTTRGLHPHLASGLRTITKHAGGPLAPEVAGYYAAAGVRCVTHRRAVTTEVAHLLNNAAYGVALMFADEMARVCRAFGVDYVEAVMEYTRSHNEGFAALDHASKARPVLTPPGGKIGGHCVVQAAQMLAAAGVDEPLAALLAAYNGVTR